MGCEPVKPPICQRPKLLLIFLVICSSTITAAFKVEEATVDDIHRAFHRGSLTSQSLVKLYLQRIQSLNPTLRAVIEVNPDALSEAAREDAERASRGGTSTGLQGIPVLLKDNIATKDRHNTTAGSLALLGSVVPRDAGVVHRLRQAGAVLLGKASLSEWAHFRSFAAPSGWCARTGQGKNPYNLSVDPCGSSSGSAIAAAASMAAVTLGTETDGSILCPSSANAVVGIKPTVGLTSRSGVIPISPRQDTVGPICRTVTDAVLTLDAIVGYDPRDTATSDASSLVPSGGYSQFLNVEGLRGKRLGILRDFFSQYPKKTTVGAAFESHFQLLRRKGAVLIDKLVIANSSLINDAIESEQLALKAEFKESLNRYLRELVTSPVRTLAEVIAFNDRNKDKEKIEEYGQDILLSSEKTTGIDSPAVRTAVTQLEKLSTELLEKLMQSNRLDAVVTPGSDLSTVLAIGGYPAVIVPAAYAEDGSPVGICFGGLRGSEPNLIEVAYAFEQATKIRRPPPRLTSPDRLTFTSLEASLSVASTGPEH